MISPALRQLRNPAYNNPVPRGSVLHLPIYALGTGASTFKSTDISEFTCTKTGFTRGNQGLVGDGDDKLGLGTNTAFDASSFTFWCWVTPTTLAGDLRTLGGKATDNQTANTSWRFIVLNDGKLRFQISTGVANVNLDSDGAVVSINNRHLIMVTYDLATTTAFMYIGSGSTFAQDKTGGAMGSMQVDNSFPLTLGYRESGTDDDFFVGTLEEFGMHNVVLSLAEGKTIFGAGIGRF